VRREEQRVLAGSLNLLTPSDKTPENDAIELQNFRVDQAGVLRGGDTFERLPGAYFGAAVHTIFPLGDLGTRSYPGWGNAIHVEFPDFTFLVGAGTKLFLYMNSTTTQIADGFDGNPLGIAIFNGFIWVMNRSKQVKVNPLVPAGYGLPGDAIVESWLPAPPATACVATADTDSTGGPVGDYTYYVTYRAAGGTAESSGSPGIAVNAEDGVVSITGLPGQSACAHGGLFSGDVMVGAIRLYRSGGTLSGTRLVREFNSLFLSDTFPSQTVPYLDTASDADIATAPLMPDTGGDGAPDAPQAAPSVVGGPILNSATQPVGDYQYYVTFVTNAGIETNPGPVSNMVTSVDGKINLSNIPVSSDASVRGRRIYRTGGTLGQAYQVADIEDNTTTKYVDSQSDLVITQLGIAMPTTNDPPPAALGLIGPYFNRLMAFDGNKLYWSQEGVPVFPGSQAGSDTGNWAEVGQADDHVQAITMHSRVAILYKQRSIWRLQGDPDTGILEQTSAAIGALGPRAVTAAGAVDYLVSNDGCFLFDLDAEHKKSAKLDPIFLGVANWTGMGATDIPLHTWDPTLPVCGWLNGTLLISDGNHSAFAMHAETERWAAVKQNLANAITAISSAGSAFVYYVGDDAGYLSQSQPGQQALGAQPIAIWQTRFLDQGLGDEPKYYQNLVLDAELNGATARVYALFDSTGSGNLSASLLGAISGTDRQKFYFPLPDGAAAKHISVRVEITSEAGAEKQFAIHGLYVYYEVEARDAAVVRMRAIDFRSEFVDIGRKLALDMNGACTLAIYTDEPGPITRAAFLKMIDTGGKRQTVTVGLPPNTRGRNWRATITPASGQTTRLYSMRAWMRSVGLAANWEWREWLTGAPAETPNAT
jgi:hypothetical protein